MKLSQVKLKGFRNFKDATINFEKKSLVIGSNDIGKTNLTWALRILLDKGLSEYDIEPRDSDFYAYDDVHEFLISLKFENVVEDCIVAKMKGKISDKDELFISYCAYRDKDSLAKTYKIFVGSAADKMEEVEERYYRKVLNIKYISCRRDFHNFISKEKHNLFYAAKQNRSEDQLKNDDKLINEISVDLKGIDEKIPQLSFIDTATDTINSELDKLSIHNQNQKIVFDAGTSDVESFITGVSISSKNNNKSLLIGGDGRLNQIYLSLWAAKHEVSEDSLTEVSIICIEEPEAHLHPHQQRKLSAYLSESIKSQVIITSHSPQIACEYSPNSIVRLLDVGNGSFAASEGCAEIIDAAFEDFGYRMSIIPAEAFFADVVLLIEGPSEEQFYKTLAKQIDIDLDRLNISVASVAGIGFKTYIQILDSLMIDYVIRTDNDIFKIPKKDSYLLAGLRRLINYYKTFHESDAEIDAMLEKHADIIKGFPLPITTQIIDAAKEITDLLEDYNFYIAEKDLETDLFNGPIHEDLKIFFKATDDELKEGEVVDIVELMKQNKAIFMYKFLRKHKECLKKLNENAICEPLIACKELVEERLK